MTPDRPRAVLLASGGMDSTVLAYWLVDRQIPFIPVFVDYGQHCVGTEAATLARVLPLHYRATVETVRLADIYRGATSRLIVAPDLWREPVRADDLYLPYRNLLVLAAAAALAQGRGCSHVYAAFINSNHAKEIDCSAAFFDRLGELMADFGGVKVEMPFRQLSKTDVARIGVALGAPVAETFSCQAAAEVPCGVCPNCVDRAEALATLTS